MVVFVSREASVSSTLSTHTFTSSLHESNSRVGPFWTEGLVVRHCTMGHSERLTFIDTSLEMICLAVAKRPSLQASSRETPYNRDM